MADRCAALNEMRPRDINLCIGVGKEHGKLDLYQEDAMSTFSNDTVEQRDMQSRPKSVTPVWTLSEVHERYCDPKQEIHFCKIDVEGYEKEVLEGIKDWKKFRPWIFAVEATLPGTNIPCHDKWENILLENDYMSALLYLPNMLTLATGLYKYQEVAERQGNYPIYFAASFM